MSIGKGYLKSYLTMLVMAALIIPSLSLWRSSTVSAKVQTAEEKDKDKKNLKEKNYHPRQLLVKSFEDVPDEEIPDPLESVLAGKGLKKLKKLTKKTAKDKNKRSNKWALYETPEGLDLLKFAKSLVVEGIVAAAAPNYYITVQASPNDPSYSSLWGLNNSNNTDIDAPEGWDIRRDASNVVVAVIDTGVRYTHQDLSGNIWTNPGEIANNNIDDDNNGYIDDIRGISALYNGTVTNNPMDEFGHGTHVAGTIGAVGNNGLGVVGVAWNVKIMPLKFMGSNGTGYTADAITCINYAVNEGAHILNNSWGFDDGGINLALQDAIEDAKDEGIIFVASAGNNATDQDSDSTPFYPAAFNLTNIVSVAAVSSTGGLSSYSNYGSSFVHIAAPGDGILSTFGSSDTDYVEWSGTSMAAPHVSGALALLKAQFPTEDYQQLINRLYAATDQLPSLVGKCRTEGKLNLAKILQTTSSEPGNNKFENQKTINSTAGLIKVSGSNAYATKSSGEPDHAGNAGGKSVWWAWTAPYSGPVKVSTKGSNFDTLLAIYTGQNITALTPIASNNNISGSDLASQLSFNAVTGTTYRIAVDGTSGASGGICLTLEYPSNDFFVDGLVTSPGIYTGLNNTATSEPGEPIHANLGGGHSAWWRYTPSQSEQLIISTSGSNFDTVLAVYTGSSVSGLATVAYNDDTDGLQSRVAFQASAGTTYHIAVDGFGSNVGNISLKVGNLAPIVNAGPDLTIDISGTASLNGEVQDDGLPSPPGQVTVQWSKLSGPGTVSFSSTTSARTTATFSATGTYDLRLSANDGAATSTDTVKVTVNATTNPPTTILNDNFEDGVADGWTVIPSGTWSVITDGSKVYQSRSTDSLSRTVTGSSTLTDYSVTSKVKVNAWGTTGTRSAGLLTRYVDTNNYYIMVFESGKLMIRKKVAGTSSTLVSKDFTFNTGVWHTFKGVVDGNKLRLYVNGKLELSTSDSSLTTGKVGLISIYADARFDDVKIEKSRLAERFSSSPAPFTTAGGTWGVVSGKYQITTETTAGAPGLNNKALHNTSVSGDFMLMADGSTVGTSNTYNDFAVIFCYQDANNYYYAQWNETDDPNTHGIFKVQGGVATQLVNFGPVITSDTTYNIDILRVGSLIQVYRNGVLQGEITNSSFTSGKVGFGTKSDKGIFDNLVVY
jgi:subtilisin family serine protease